MLVRFICWFLILKMCCLFLDLRDTQESGSYDDGPSIQQEVQTVQVVQKIAPVTATR